MATLKEIAQKAGVSMMTVSNVVNGKTEKVSKETLGRIQALIKECNYVPNLNARTLVKSTSQTIVVFVSTFVSHENVSRIRISPNSSGKSRASYGRTGITCLSRQ